MNDSPVTTVDQINSFVQLDAAFECAIKGKRARYQWIGEVLQKFKYHRLTKKEKSPVRAYLRKVTHTSISQLTRLILTHKRRGTLVPNYASPKRHRFKKKYGSTEIARLIATDIAHNHLSGQATKKILVREYETFNHREYATVSQISSAHIYAIRKHNRQYTSSPAKYLHRTAATKVAIGIRAKPRPDGRPGYLRIDTVHSGDLNGEKGVYHINIVDEVTQWEMVATVAKITEQYLLPVIEELLACFPFVIHEFHADNGSEYINHVVAELLAKLYVRFTKSRARCSNDNALVESKNGSVIRKMWGHNHMPARYASIMNEFNRGYVNGYLNYHRPCGFAQEYIDARGKIKKKYTLWMTPYEKFKSLPDATQYLKKGITFAQLQVIAMEKSDNAFAETMNKAKVELFKRMKSF